MSYVGTKNQLRCFCSRKPLLAVYGRDKTGRAYVHVRTFKQSRIFSDVICYGGEVKICCRECIRWHVISFVDSPRVAAVLERSVKPDEVDIPESSPDKAEMRTSDSRDS